jgi:anti-sigma regulatory factor (Ser/Thr protein kinase)
MAEPVHTRFHLPDRTYQAIVRADIKKIAESTGFTGYRLGEVEIIIAEITSNLVKHAAKGGTLLVRKIDGEQAGMEIINESSSEDDGRWPFHKENTWSGIGSYTQAFGRI